MVIGSACIVLVVTVAVTGRRYVIGQIEGVGSNLVYANYEVNPQQAMVMSNEITLADMNAMKAMLPNVVAVAGTRSMQTTVVDRGPGAQRRAGGRDRRLSGDPQSAILQGRFLDSDDLQSRSKVCLITDELAALAFPNQRSDGRKIARGRPQFHRHRRVSARGSARSGSRRFSATRCWSLSAHAVLHRRQFDRRALRPGATRPSTSPR